MQAVPAATRADWERLVTKALGDRPPRSLDAEIAAGLAAPPLAEAGSLPALWSRGGAGWQRLARLDRPDEAALAAARATGADGVALVLAGAATAFSGGIDIGGLPALLDGLDLDRWALRLDAAAEAGPVTEAIEGAMARQRLDAERIAIAFGFDPFGARAAGTLDGPALDAALSSLADVALRLAGEGHRGPILSADGRLVHAAGGDAVTELGYALAARAALLRRLDAAGLAPDRLPLAIDVALAADIDQFVTIAKLRAMRLLDARLLAAAGLPPARLALHAETSFRMMAAEDSRSNIIRTTIAALSAAIGGADSIAVLPWTDGNADAARLALTTQAILAEEAGIARVDDPAAGSGTIDGLTLALARAAWAAFQAIEQAGGLAASLAAGTIQRRVLESAAVAEARLASGEAALVGVTLFRADGGAAAVPASSAPPPPDGFVPLVARRRAAAFERAEA